MKIYTAIIDVGDDAAYDAFYDWLETHQNKIEAISDNEGCGCCIDLYYIGLPGEVEKEDFLSPATSAVDSVKLHYGTMKDRIIDEI